MIETTHWKRDDGRKKKRNNGGAYVICAMMACARSYNFNPHGILALLTRVITFSVLPLSRINQ